MVIRTDFNLWNLLFQGYTKQPRHRYTKAEAYFDIINRQRLTTLTGDEEFIDATLQDLANAWSWDRGSVRKFIEALSEIGAVTFKKDDRQNNKTVIRVNNVSGLTPIREVHPTGKTYDSESSNDSNISGRTPTPQGAMAHSKTILNELRSAPSERSKKALAHLVEKIGEA